MKLGDIGIGFGEHGDLVSKSWCPTVAVAYRPPRSKSGLGFDRLFTFFSQLGHCLSDTLCRLPML